jgi:DNA-directed RNA polymerase subunit RPC12/RpoP
MAYLKDIHKPDCYRCRKRAVTELFNHRNASLGYYCRQCSKQVLRIQKEQEGQA